MADICPVLADVEENLHSALRAIRHDPGVAAKVEKQLEPAHKKILSLIERKCPSNGED